LDERLFCPGFSFAGGFGVIGWEEHLAENTEGSGAVTAVLDEELAGWTHRDMTLPDDLDTVVGDGGHRLSGGEKQRVALARVLLKAPSVVIMDEATAHLDPESELAVRRALKSALKNRTSLVIAHRLSTIREADQILVIDDGRIVECGIHEELLASGGPYADFYHAQFTGQGAFA
jgi:ATP-binding cassette, subfamily B, bacterial